MKNESLNLETKRPAKWTWLELSGLSVALFLIIWPVLTLAYGLFFPVAAKAQQISALFATPTNPAPNSSYTYTIDLELTGANQTFTDLRVTLPAGITYISSGCVSNCGFLAGNGFAGGVVTFNGNLTPTTGPTIIRFAINVSVNSSHAAGDNLTVTAIARVDSSPIAPFVYNHQVGSGTGTTVPVTTATTLAPTTPPVTTAPPTTAPPTTAPPTTVATTPPVTTAPPTATSTATATGTAATATATATGTAPTATATATATGTAATATATATGTAATATATATGTAATATATATGTAPTATSTATATAQPTATEGGGIPVPTEIVTVSSLPTRSGNQPTATPVPTATPAPPTVAQGQPTATGTPPQVADGVISGRFTGGSLGGVRVELVRRGNTTTNIPSALDNNGNYSFLSVRATGSGEVYFIRFSNPNGGTLRTWETNSFTFSGGRLDLPAIDVSDVALGAPGSSNTVFQLPLTLNWSARNGDDAYQITVSRSDGSGVVFRSNSLGNATSLTLQPGSLQPGEYFATVNVSNGNGSGSSSRQFQFRIGAGNFIPVNPTTAPPPAQTTAAQVQPTARPAQPTTARPVVATTVAQVQTTVAQAQPTAARTTTVAATAAVPAVSPTVIIGGQDPNQVGQGSGNNGNPTPGRNSGTGNNPGTSAGSSSGGDTGSLPGGTQELPQSGGELPLLGLLIAALTLGFRRIRLVTQKRIAG